MASPKIAIIGAGPAGCMLARILHNGGVAATVFESDASPEARSQGGTLDLHTESGLAAMKEAGLFDEFLKHARYEGQYLAFVDKDLYYLAERGAGGRAKNHVGESPEIDRSKLREFLINSLPEGMIRWGHHLTKVEGNKLVFKDGSATGYDLVVGADGAWSKVRAAIDPSLEPMYTGVGGFELIIPDAENTAPETYKLVNRGSIFAGWEGQRVTIQQLGDGSLWVHPTFVREVANWMDHEVCGYDSTDRQRVMKALHGEFSEWCPELRDALTSTEGKPVPRSMYTLPPGTKWEHTPGFTLIGDAAHLMTPHAGEGANQALEDSMLLGRAILGAIKDGKDIDSEIKTFEDNMFVRTGKMQQLSYDLTQDWMFTPGAPKSVMPRAMSRHVNSTIPSILHPLSTAGIYSYFFFKGLFS